MGWLEAIVEIIKAIAWPLSAIAIVWMLRKPIASLPRLLRRVKYKDLEAEFGEALERVQEAADDADLPDTNELLDNVVRGETPLERYKRLANISPPAAVLEAWREIEVAASEIITDSGTGSSGMYSAEMIDPGVIRRLEKSGMLDESKRFVLRSLRELRNRAVHAKRHGLTAEDAYDYAIAALRMAEHIRRQAGSWGSSED